MRRFFETSSLFVLNGLIILSVIVFSLFGNQAVTTMVPESPIHTIIIDAGHGGVDGGAVSCTGVYESQINLEIALRLDDLFHLLGAKTVMIRTSDISVYTEGETIAAKKVSDIKQRVQIANTTPYAIYLSIHQNNFADPRYWGSQIFYNGQSGSQEFASQMQTNLKNNLQQQNNRKIKKSSGVYLMEHMNCTGILIECGFLSNPSEEELLRNSEYQKKLCCVVAATTCQYVNT